MSIRSSLLPAGTPRAAFVMIVLNESRIARRLPLGLLVGVVLPTVLLVVIGSVRRRLSVTPGPPAWGLAAQLVLNAGFAVLELALLLVVAMTGFGVAAPKSAGGLALALSLSIAGVFAIGLWVSAIARPRTAGILAAVCFFPLMFFAGLFLPRAEMPGPLLEISNLSPLGAAVQAVQSALLEGFPPTAPLLVLPAYAVIFSALAVRFFRWE